MPHGVVQVALSSSVAVALADTGQVYTWGGREDAWLTAEPIQDNPPPPMPSELKVSNVPWPGSDRNVAAADHGARVCAGSLCSNAARPLTS